ncbi:MAG: carbamoyltransferase N-terminal domain-containing protein [Planctomycetota bacterium]
MPNILGVSAHFHDSAAALVRGGRPVAAVAEERLSRIKHDSRFPEAAIASCLETAQLEPQELDWVVFHEKPFRTFERVLENQLAVAPRAPGHFLASMSAWTSGRLEVRQSVRRVLGDRFVGRIGFACHHESHSASAFYASPFDNAAILTIDGVGSWHTATLGVGRGAGLQLFDAIDFPHSIGLFYAAATAFAGFEVNEGEYKLMGLAATGTPIFEDLIHEKLVEAFEDGSFRLRPGGFDFLRGKRMFSRSWTNWFDGPPRKPESPLRQRERDLAASVQKVTETLIENLALAAIDRSGCNKLCLAGGVAMNGLAVGRLADHPKIEQVFVQPAAGDAGCALGAALIAHHRWLNQPRESLPAAPDRFLGPAIVRDGLADRICQAGFKTESLSPQAMSRRLAVALADGKVVARVTGGMEFGPRALGHRSLLGDPRRPEMRSRMNQNVKRRESFRPFAPAVLADFATGYFEIDDPHAWNFMTMTQVVHAREVAMRTMPAVIHADGTARVQVVDSDSQADLTSILEAFQQRTGCPALINTSFNLRGQPVVASLTDALESFAAMDIDVLAIEDQWVSRPETSPPAIQAEPAMDAGLFRRTLGSIRHMMVQAPFAIVAVLLYYVLVTPIGIVYRRFGKRRLVDFETHQAGSAFRGHAKQSDPADAQRSY